MLAAVVVLVVTVLAATAFEVWRQRATSLTAAEAQLASLSQALTQQTGHIFTAVDLVLAHSGTEVLGGDTDVDMRAKEVRVELMERVVGLPFIVELQLADSNGTVVNSTHPLPGPPENLSPREHFSVHLDAHIGSHIGLPSWSAPHHRWVIPVSRRIDTPTGGLMGAVIALVDASYLQEIYQQVLPAQGGAFALYRTDATLLTRFPHLEEAMGQPFGHLSMFEKVTTAPHGTFRVPRSLDGQPRIISYTASGRHPLLLAVSLDEQVLLAPWRDNAARLLLGAFLAMALLAAAFATMLRQLRGQKAQAAVLRNSEMRRRFAQFAIDHAADMALWIDRDGRVRYANQAACWHFGWPSEDLPELALGEVDIRVGAEGWPHMLETLRTEKYLRYESQHRTRAGDLFPTEVSVNYVVFEGAEYICAFVRDIGERRAAEMALAEKTARLEASNAELEQFAYVASHDLREPLRMVNSFVAMLAQRYADRLDDDALEFIGFAREGATRMDRLILDLLEFSRVSRIERPQVPVALSHPVATAIKGLALAIDESGATITVAPDLPLVMANDEELVRLFLNLLGNALKYRHSERPPVLHIASERHGGEVRVSVSDNGIGIAPEYFERIFRIFQRLHGRDKYDGTGIGLAICKKIVERHGGRIWLESIPDQGTTFLFTLRAAPQDRSPGRFPLPAGEGQVRAMASA